MFLIELEKKQISLIKSIKINENINKNITIGVKQIFYFKLIDAFIYILHSVKLQAHKNIIHNNNKNDKNVNEYECELTLISH